MGLATTYFTSNDSKHAQGLIEILKTSNQYVDPELLDMADDNMRKNGGKKGPKRGKFAGKPMGASSYGNGQQNGFGNNGF